MPKEYEISQEIFDEIVHRFKEQRNPTEKDLIQLIQMIQHSYYGYDPIVVTLTKDQLRFNIDLIMRSFSIYLKRGWGNDSNYIMSNLVAASSDLVSENRKKIFIEKNIYINDEVSFHDRFGFATFYFASINRKPNLLIKHEYGTTVMFGAEEVISEIQNLYMSRMGFDITRDSIPIYVRDDEDYYYEAKINDQIEVIDWPILTDDQIRWYDETWESLMNREVGEVEEVPLFFEKGQPYSAIKPIRRLFSKTQKEIFIIDPYVDDSTISLFESIQNSVSIKLLYGKMQKDAPELARRFKEERGLFEFRKAKDLHDRFLFCDDHAYMLGSSLNNFGSKATSLTPIRDSGFVENIKNYFDRVWNDSVLNT